MVLARNRAMCAVFVKVAAKEACWQMSQTNRGSRAMRLPELGAEIEVVVVQLQRDDQVVSRTG